MSVKKTISIDLWGTLIKSSPEFSPAKMQLVREFFPTASVMIIDQAFKETKQEFNKIIEKTGWQPPNELIFQYLVSKLFYYGFTQDPEHIAKFKQAYQKLAIEHHPIIYSQQTINVLKRLSKEFTLVISSNTMLIEGSTLRIVLDKLKIAQYFEHFYFSDNMLHAKPHAVMFGKSDFHIGDNFFTDYHGAEKAGSKPIIINSTKLTIQDAFDLITQNRNI